MVPLYACEITCSRWLLQTLGFPVSSLSPAIISLESRSVPGPGFLLWTSPFATFQTLPLAFRTSSSLLWALSMPLVSWIRNSVPAGPAPPSPLGAQTQVVLQLQTWAWHLHCCRQIWTSLAHTLLSLSLGCPSPCSVPFFSLFFPSKCSSLLKDLFMSHLLHESDCSGSQQSFLSLRPSRIYSQFHSIQISIPLHLLPVNWSWLSKPYNKLLTEAEAKPAHHWYCSQPRLHDARPTTGSCKYLMISFHTCSSSRRFIQIRKALTFWH